MQCVCAWILFQNVYFSPFQNENEVGMHALNWVGGYKFISIDDLGSFTCCLYHNELEYLMPGLCFCGQPANTILDIFLIFLVIGDYLIVV